MANTIGFEGVIEGVEKMINGPQLVVRPITTTGKIPTNMWVILAPDFILRANKLWSGKIVKGGDYIMRANTLLKGKKIIFYIKD